MPLPPEERALLAAINPPPSAEVRAAADKFLALTGTSVPELAELVRRDYGRCGRSTLLLWFRGQYSHEAFASLEVKNQRYMDARVWDYIQRH